MKSITKLFCIMLILSPSTALSWGKNGHRIVAEIAERHLSAQARNEVQGLLQNRTLAEISNWADEIRSDSSWDKAVPWHYINVEDNYKVTNSSEKSKNNIVSAIDRFLLDLADKKKTKSDREIALKFLVHLIADLHQPLHAGSSKDAGGTMARAKWFGEKTDLHAIWDEKLIELQKLSYTEYVAFLDKVSPDKIGIWEKATIYDIANESKNLRSALYEYVTDSKYNKKYSEYLYSYKYLPVLNERLQMGGIRLAHLLNSTLK